MYSMQDLIVQARKQTGRKVPIAKELHYIRVQLRERRKQFLGSYVSLGELIAGGHKPDEQMVEKISDYLAARTAVLWTAHLPEEYEFCHQFYELAIYATCGGGVGGESIDDIIQLASCLVRSKEVYVDVMRGLLPKDMIAAMFRFIEEYPAEYYHTAFEDAVMGAISVFLGALADPLTSEEDTNNG